jgi:hypothetical protein
VSAKKDDLAAADNLPKRKKKFFENFTKSQNSTI